MTAIVNGLIVVGNSYITVYINNSQLSHERRRDLQVDNSFNSCSLCETDRTFLII